MEHFKKILVIAGPTGSGKSRLAIAIAKKIPAVIINADSMQVYEEIPLLSDQPSLTTRSLIPHKLYSFMTHKEVCSAAIWADRAAQEIKEARRQNNCQCWWVDQGFISKA